MPNEPYWWTPVDWTLPEFLLVSSRFRLLTTAYHPYDRSYIRPILPRFLRSNHGKMFTKNCNTYVELSKNGKRRLEGGGRYFLASLLVENTSLSCGERPGTRHEFCIAACARSCTFPWHGYHWLLVCHDRHQEASQQKQRQHSPFRPMLARSPSESEGAWHVHPHTWLAEGVPCNIQIFHKTHHGIASDNSLSSCPVKPITGHTCWDNRLW